MKKNIFFASAMLLFTLLSSFAYWTIDSDAKEDQYLFEFKCDYTLRNPYYPAGNKDQVCHVEQSALIPSGWTVYAYVRSGDPTSLCFCLVNDASVCLSSSNCLENAINPHYLLEWYYFDTPSDLAKNDKSTFSTSFVFREGAGSNDPYDVSYLCNVDFKLFDSRDSLSRFILNGDTSGQIDIVIGNEDHDFANDLIDTEIPLAQINKVSHNGFSLVNRDDYSVDLYVESYLYGVKHRSFFPKVTFAVDSNWVFASHKYNFDSQHINSDSVDLASYGVDNASALATDFKQYSTAYPKPSSLPDYTWYKTSVSGGMYENHTWSDSLTPQANLARSEQGCTVYYVRYYHMVDGKKVGGRWMQYKFKDGDGEGKLDGDVLISSGTVIGAGVANVDSDGNIYITDSVNGRQDLEGNITYTTDSTDLSIDKAFSVIEEMVNALGKVPKLLETVFPFLPWWCTGALSAALIICIILRIAGR